MHTRALLSAFFCFLLSVSSQGQKPATAGKAPAAATIDGHPAWIEQGNIYEVNVRQYTPQGTFRAFEPNLQRLKSMGVQTLWFMPLNPISQKDRKGALGSYYAVSNYTAINPEYGTLADWKSLVKKAHALGFKILIDWVPNHTGADHPWLSTHTDFYEKDSSGKPLSPFDWTDVRQLDFKNAEMKDSMTAALKYWVTQTDIDGFRCDHVEKFQMDFWKSCIPQLRKIKKLLMLAEVEEPWVYEAGFDMDYGWNFFHTMVDIASGKRTAVSLDTVLYNRDHSAPRSALQLYFTSNHDENSWNKADYGTMPGASHAPFAVLTQTLDRSIPLVYSGQEEPVLDSISFFYKDTIHFGKYQRAGFYKKLLDLRKRHPALAANASFKKLSTSDDAAIYAYERVRGADKVLVILNLSPSPRKFTWKVKPSARTWNNVFAGNKEPVDRGFGLEPWGYAVFELHR
ncbi:MAG: alpha-amylase family glycosyl hydrolase [Flavisolibacter sp.]